VGDGLLHVGARCLGADPLLQQDDLRQDVIELPGEVREGFVVADAGVLPDWLFVAVDGQENVAVALNPAPA
jgi:hypothetical protein